MMTKKTLSAAILCSLFAFPAWVGAAAPAQVPAVSPTGAPTAAATAASRASAQNQASYDLTFPAAKGTKESIALDNRQVSYYAWRDLVYVSHPQNADCEKMNIFIPSAYLEGKSVNRLGQRPRGRLRSGRIVCLDRFHLQIKKDRCLGSGFFIFSPDTASILPPGCAWLFLGLLRSVRRPDGLRPVLWLHQKHRTRCRG